MQKLKLEEKWAKTIAKEDFQEIEKIFNGIKFGDQENVFFTFLSEAINHRGELLIITLVHNVTNASYILENQALHYKVNDEIRVTHYFSMPVKVAAKTSMPWTFIFPKSKVQNKWLNGSGSIVMG